MPPTDHTCPKPHIRTILKVTGASILLGLLTTVATAWAVCLWPGQTFTFVNSITENIAPPGAPSYLGAFTITDEYRTAFTRADMASLGPQHPLNATIATRIMSQVAELADDPPPRQLGGYVYPRRHPSWPAWLPTIPDEQSYTTWSARAAGWPVLCMTSFGRQQAGQAARVTIGALPVIPKSYYRSRTSDPDAGALPLIPFWPGLLLNTALYAPLWWSLLFAPALLRRAHRRRRGLCSACGYDRRGGLTTGCPECGLGRTSVPTAP